MRLVVINFEKYIMKRVVCVCAAAGRQLSRSVEQQLCASKSDVTRHHLYTWLEAADAAFERFATQRNRAAQKASTRTAANGENTVKEYTNKKTHKMRSDCWESAVPKVWVQKTRLCVETSLLYGRGR